MVHWIGKVKKASPSWRGFRVECDLLELVNESVRACLAIRSLRVGNQGASLAIGRKLDGSGGRRFAALLVGKRVGILGGHLDGASVGRLIADECVILAIEFSGPLIVQCCAGSIDSFDNAFVAVAF